MPYVIWSIGYGIRVAGMWCEDTHNSPQYTFTIVYYAKWCEYTRTRRDTHSTHHIRNYITSSAARRKCKDVNQKIIKSYLLYLHLMYTHTHSTRKMSANMLPSAHTTQQRACTDTRHRLWVRVIITIFRFVNSVLDCVQFCHKCARIKAHQNVWLSCLPPRDGVMCTMHTLFIDAQRTHSANARCSCR